MLLEPSVTNCHTFSDPLPLESDLLYGRPLGLLLTDELLCDGNLVRQLRHRRYINKIIGSQFFFPLWCQVRIWGGQEEEAAWCYSGYWQWQWCRTILS